MATKYPLFSNGTEFMLWQARNCERCVKAVFFDERKNFCPKYRCAVQAMLHVLEKGVKQGRREILNNLWKPAGGNNLPEVDREVIVLLSNNKVCFAHRPQEYWDGTNIETGETTRHYPKRYDKGGWNIPDVKWWLDLDLPNMEE